VVSTRRLIPPEADCRDHSRTLLRLEGGPGVIPEIAPTQPALDDSRDRRKSERPHQNDLSTPGKARHEYQEKRQTHAHRYCLRLLLEPVAVPPLRFRRRSALRSSAESSTSFSAWRLQRTGSRMLSASRLSCRFDFAFARYAESRVRTMMTGVASGNDAVSTEAHHR
jgi:hypothetical protein